MRIKEWKGRIKACKYGVLCPYCNVGMHMVEGVYVCPKCEADYKSNKGICILIRGGNQER